MIVVAVRGASCAILLAGFRDQATNLARRFGNRTLVVVRLVMRHFRDQKFKIVGHTLLQ